MLTGVVLAGGLSSRMGQDKSQLLRHQQTMLAFTASQLQKAGVDQVVISGPQHLDTQSLLVIPDQQKQMGPLGGISAIVHHLKGKTEHLLFVPVDLPLLDHEQLITLKHEGLARDKVVMYRGQPLPLFLPMNDVYLAKLDEQINEASNLSIRCFVDQCQGEILRSSNQDSWFNSNTPEDWQKALSMLQQRS